MIYQHPLAYLLALQGGALLRAFNGEYDREFTLARLAEVRALLDSADELGDDVTTRPITALPHYPRATSEYLACAIPLGFQVRSCEELRSARRDPDDAPAAVRELPPHPSDIWMLGAWCLAAARAALSGTPCLIFWHFQLG